MQPKTVTVAQVKMMEHKCHFYQLFTNSKSLWIIAPNNKGVLNMPSASDSGLPRTRPSDSPIISSLFIASSLDSVLAHFKGGDAGFLYHLSIFYLLNMI